MTGGPWPRRCRAETGLQRPFLHAGKLRLIHPTTGETCEWEAPLPADLVEVLARLT